MVAVLSDIPTRATLLQHDSDGLAVSAGDTGALSFAPPSLERDRQRLRTMSERSLIPAEATAVQHMATAYVAAIDRAPSV